MELTTNYSKHTNSSPIQQFLLRQFNKKLIDCVRKTNPNTILDAGCGEGFTMNLLSEAGIHASMTGIDFSDTAISIAQKISPNLNIKKASIYLLPYRNASFDLIICSEVLEHLEDPDTALSEIIRVSKKYILVSVPNEPYFQCANFFRGKYFQSFGNHPEHINDWSSRSIVEKLKNAGLSILSV